MVWDIVAITALAGMGGTGMGGLISCLFRKDSSKTVSLLLSFAAGVMTSVVCFDLLTEALHADAVGNPVVLVVTGVLLGYIADENQAAFLAEQCESWHRAGVPIFLDPIFADNGKLYRGITQERLDFLKNLLRQVDFVLPNLTEAQFLTGEADPCRALRGLMELGARGAAITGVPLGEENAVLLALGAETETLPYTPIPGNFSGAGDAFTALFTGGILSGKSPRESAQTAIRTTKQWIQQSLTTPSAIIGLPVERYFG